MELTNTDLSVVVVPDGDLGREVLQMATAWSGAGLLRPSVWLSPGNVKQIDGGPPQVLCTRLDGPSSSEIDLFTVVGLRRLTRVRLVVVHVSGLERQEHDTLSALGRQLSDLLRSALPLGTSEEDRGTTLLGVKLLVPSTGAHDLPRDTLQADWDVNVIVSPEDRPDVDRGSVFVRPGINQVGHITSAVCSVSGLWSGVPVGGIDSITSDSTTGDGWLHVIRPTVRAVTGVNRVESLASQALEMVDEADPSDFIRWGRKASHPTQLAATAAHAVATAELWAPPHLNEAVVEGRDVRGLSDVASSAFRYNLALFGTGWRWFLDRGERAIDRRMTSALVGDEADIQVVRRPQRPTELTRLARYEESVAERKLKQRIAHEPVVAEPPAPEIWRDLRQVTFGLVDGGELSEEVRPASVGALVDVLPRSSVLPAPGDVLAGDAEPVGIVDVLSFRHHLKKLEAAAAAAEPVATADESEETQPPTATEEPQEPHGVDSDTPDAETVLEQAQDWLARRRDSFGWLLATKLADQLEVATQRLRALDPESSESTEQAHQELESAYRRLLRTWRAGVVTPVLLAGVLVVLWLVYDLTALQLVLLAAVGVIGLVTFIAGEHHRYFKADLRWRKEILRILRLRHDHVDRVFGLRRDISWLQGRYDGLMVWAPILAEVVHRPWGEVAQSGSELTDAEIEKLPAAVAIASSTGLDEQRFSTGVMTDAVNVVCRQSYLSRAWDVLFEAFLEDSGRTDSSAIHVVDSDELDTVASPRRELLQFIRHGAGRNLSTEQMVTRLAEAVADGEVRLPPLLVKRLGQYSDGEVIEEEDFYASSLRSATPFTIDFWSPEGQVASKHLISKSLVWLPSTWGSQPSPPIELHRSSGRVACRLDFSRRCSAEDVVAILPRESQDHRPTWDESDFQKFN